MTARRTLLLALLAGGCERGATDQPTPGPAPALAPAIPRAAATLAASFAPEIVGTLAPITPVAGDYAMTLSSGYQTFVTTELSIADERKGALHLTLARDGTAHGCVGAVHHHASRGQIHYERDPTKRQHSESTTAQLRAVAGTWKIVDGVAVIVLDRTAGSTCDASAAGVTNDPVITELRCIGFAKTDRVPGPGLACDASERNRLLDLGMPMSVASRAKPPSRDSAPSGTSFVLGAPGIALVVEQLRDDHVPRFTLRAEAAPLVEADFLPPR